MTAATSFHSIVSFFGKRPTSVALERGSWLDPVAVAFWIMFAPIRLLLWAIGTSLALTISRYREYSADRGAAVLTGTGSPDERARAAHQVEGAPRADRALA